MFREKKNTLSIEQMVGLKEQAWMQRNAAGVLVRCHRSEMSQEPQEQWARKKEKSVTFGYCSGG